MVRIMKKKHITTSLALLFMAIMQFTPGCMMIGVHDDFVYLPSSRQASGDFIPCLYVQDNTLSIPLLLFRIDIDRLPHSFVMLQYDPTYLNTHEGFSSFILDDLYIEFSNGTRVNCIDPSLPKVKRTYSIPDKDNWKYEPQVFDGVITKRMNFTVHTVGTATKVDGTVVPFTRTSKYEYNGKDATFHTIFDEWASC